MAFADFLQDYDEAPKGSKSGKSSPITDQLLDNLYQVESSKRPNVVNEKSGALGGYQFMPDTVKMLSKKGINFDPMKADQAREAARSYLSMLVDQNGGDIRKALAQYGGFKEKDPTSYVNAVLGGAPNEKAANQSSFASFLNDEDMPHATTPSNAGAGRGSYAGYNMAQDVANTATAKPVEAPNTPTGFGLNVLNKAQELKHAIIPAAANVADVTIGSALPLVAGAITQPLARLGTTPERAEQIAQNVSGYLSQPFGKALGVTNQPGYANSDVNKLMTALGNGISALGEKANITPQSISKVTGLPIQDVRYGLNILGLGVAPEAAGLAGKIGQGLEAAKAELGANEMVNKPSVNAPTEQTAKAGSVGAAAAEANPFSGEISGEEKAKRELFPAYKLSKSSQDVPNREQDIRSEVARTINPSGQVREGVITGNENTLRNEYQEAKNPERTPKGELLRQQIAQEQNALSDFAQKRIEATGASPTLTNDEQRGMRINDAFYGANMPGEEPTSLKGFLQQAKQVIYDDAKAKIGDTPVETNHIDRLFNNPQWKAGLKISNTTDVAQGASELLKLAKEVGFEDDHGVMHPAGSVSAYDAVRKSLNSKWKHENASTIASINQAIDKDIAEVADPKMYKLGDKIHQAEKTIYDSEAIKKLFGETNEQGVVQSRTPSEKIPSKLNNLRKDEWRHVRDTLKDLSNGIVRGAPEGLPPVPESVRQSARTAVAEIDGALARAVYDAGGGRVGVWNQNDVNKVLNSVVGEKIAETFDPSEVKNYHVLNVGGHIMPGVHSYEGGAAQAQRMGLIAGNAGKLGAGAGAFVGSAFGPYGTAIGTYLGGKGGAALGEKSFEKSLQKQAKKEQMKMQKNANRPDILKLGENKE